MEMPEVKGCYSCARYQTHYARCGSELHFGYCTLYRTHKMADCKTCGTWQKKEEKTNGMD